MTIPKKGSRRIQVGENHYRWVANGNDNTINVTVQLEQGKGQKLVAYFNYRNLWTPKGDSSFARKFQGRSVTPKSIELIMEWALKNGWEPGAQGKPFLMGVDKTSKLVPVTVFGEKGEYID